MLWFCSETFNKSLSFIEGNLVQRLSGSFGIRMPKVKFWCPIVSMSSVQLEVRLLAKCEEAREGIRGRKFKKKELDWGNMVGLPGALKIGLIRRPGRIECVRVCVGHVHRRGFVRFRVCVRANPLHTELFSRMAALVAHRVFISPHSHMHFIKSVFFHFCQTFESKVVVPYIVPYISDDWSWASLPILFSLSSFLSCAMLKISILIWKTDLETKTKVYVIYSEAQVGE